MAHMTTGNLTKPLTDKEIAERYDLPVCDVQNERRNFWGVRRYDGVEHPAAHTGEHKKEDSDLDTDDTTRGKHQHHPKNTLG